MTISKTERLKRFYRVSPYTRYIREMVRLTAKSMFHLMCKVKVSGFENVPLHGPYLVVFNHVSLYDPPVVLTFWPNQLEILGAIDVWSRKGQGILARLWGGIPINRDEIHRDAMNQTLAVLNSNLPLLISPEGGRSHAPGLRRAKTGVVYLAEASQAPIIPVGIVGTTDDFLQNAFQGKKPTIEMNIGEAFTVPDPEDAKKLFPKEIRQKKADYIMSKIAKLLPTNYRGYYEATKMSSIDVIS